MHDSERVKRLDTKAHLDENFEDHLLREHLVVLAHALDAVG